MEKGRGQKRVESMHKLYFIYKIHCTLGCPTTWQRSAECARERERQQQQEKEKAKDPTIVTTNSITLNNK